MAAAQPKQTIAATSMFMMVEEEEVLGIYCDIREHRFWTRKWEQDRDKRDECNTMYKFQQELLQVCTPI